MDDQAARSWLTLTQAALESIDVEMAALERAAADLHAELARPLPEVRLPNVAALTLPPASAPSPRVSAPPPPAAVRLEPARDPAEGMTWTSLGTSAPPMGGAPGPAEVWEGLASQSADPDVDLPPLDDPEAALELAALSQWGAPVFSSAEAAPADDATAETDTALAAEAPRPVRKSATRLAAWTSS